MNALSDFVVENGILTKYNGEGGDVTIPEGVTELARGVFSWSESIKSIALPNGVERIGECAFHECKNLESVSIPDTVISIGKDAFAYCKNLTIHVPSDSYAAHYAKGNNISFVVI
ncbi:MAG: leucine-rich repeat domain-containing protein [Clostridia bacterium]|nr:leucine-rich repeat domain-containing protein [Clostridia bacterium]